LLDVVRVALDDTVDGEVSVLGRSRVLRLREVEVLVLEGVLEFVDERRVADDGRVRSVRDDDDLVPRRTVVPADARHVELRELLADVPFLAGDEQRFPHLVVPVGLRFRRGRVPGLVRELASWDDGHRDAFFELLVPDLLDARHRARDERLEFLVGESV